MLLFNGGVPVTIPRAERFAVHKLIVAVEPQDQTKSAKDILQAGTLIEVLFAKRPMELASAWQAAWSTGPRWRDKLAAGRGRLPAAGRETLAGTIERMSGRRPRLK